MLAYDFKPKTQEELLVSLYPLLTLQAEQEQQEYADHMSKISGRAFSGLEEWNAGSLVLRPRSHAERLYEAGLRHIQSAVLREKDEDRNSDQPALLPS